MDAFLQTLLGGVLTLAGTFVALLFQRQHERWQAIREDTQRVRDKAQELFDELDRLVHESGSASVRALARLRDESLDPIAIPDLGRARALTALYFPSTLDVIANFENRHGEMMVMVAKQVEDTLRNGMHDTDTMKAQAMMMVINFQQLATDFVATMRVEVIKLLPKLQMDDQRK